MSEGTFGAGDCLFESLIGSFQDMLVHILSCGVLRKCQRTCIHAHVSFALNGHQVLPKINAAHNQAARGTVCSLCHIAFRQTTVRPRRLVALFALS